MNHKFLIMMLAATLCLSGCSGKPADAPAPAPESIAESAAETTVEVMEESPADTDFPESDLSGIFDKEVNTQTVNASPVTFVVSGVKYTSPSDYLVTYFEEIGPMVYMNNIFQMKMVRKETTFAELLKGLAELDDKAINNGAESVLEPATKEIGGKTFAYFVVKIGHEDTLGVMTESPDGKFCIGGQIAIQSEDVNYDDLLNMYATIAATAELTSEPDSTEEEVMAQVKYITGEKRAKSTVTYKSASVTYAVPDGYFFTSENTGSLGATQFYSAADLDVSISIEEKAFPEDTAESAIDALVQYEENGVKSVEEVDGKKIFIGTSHYTSDNGRTYYDLTARYDMNDEYTYVVNANCADSKDGDISFERVKGFFEIED